MKSLNFNNIYRALKRRRECFLYQIYDNNLKKNRFKNVEKIVNEILNEFNKIIIILIKN